MIRWIKKMFKRKKPETKLLKPLQPGEQSVTRQYLMKQLPTLDDTGKHLSQSKSSSSILPPVNNKQTEKHNEQAKVSRGRQ